MNQQRIYKKMKSTYLNDKKWVKENLTAKRMKGCMSKMGYDTEFGAEIAAAKQRKRAYKCIYCSHYHLTSKRVHI